MAWRNSHALSKNSSSLKSSIGTPLFARGVTAKADLVTADHTSDDILQIKDGKVLFAGFSSKELLRTLFNLHLVAYEPIVDLSIKVLSSPLMRSPLLQAPILPVVKRTAYSHFCAGEDVEEASKTLQRMWDLGLRGILDYGLEDATDNESCDKNLGKFVQVVQQTSRLPQGSVSATILIQSRRFESRAARVASLSRFRPIWGHFHLRLQCWRSFSYFSSILVCSRYCVFEIAGSSLLLKLESLALSNALTVCGWG